MHIIKSIISKKQSHTMSNFTKSKYAKRLRTFKDIHSGKACFIIGNGPSLKPEDLDILHKNNIPCFAFNRIYLMFEKTNWRPTYYISQDEKTLKNCREQVNNLDIQYKFIPLQNKYYHGIDIKGAYYFNFINQNNTFPLFSSDVSEGVGNSSTVAFTAAQIAAYIGYKKIYMIGVDHNFSTYKGKDGVIVRDKSARDYFSDEYNKDKSKLYIPNLEASNGAYTSMKNYCDVHGIEVYNATRGGKLEIFPRVDFDSLFKGD